MALQEQHQMALKGLNSLPTTVASQLLYDAQSTVADGRIEAMALELQELPNVGRRTALGILFALALALEELPAEDGQ